MSRVKIISGGDFSNTTVLIDGKEQVDVSAVRWRLEPNDGVLLAIATIDFVNVEVELEGDLAEDDGIELERQ